MKVYFQLKLASNTSSSTRIITAINFNGFRGPFWLFPKEFRSVNSHLTSIKALVNSQKEFSDTVHVPYELNAVEKKTYAWNTVDSCFYFKNVKLDYSTQKLCKRVSSKFKFYSLSLNSKIKLALKLFSFLFFKFSELFWSI